ncbi:hypothetical protein CH359_18550 [Leptospira meyeri]|nr:hypothetical protein CH359_18550 [Leptospira meyeri]
MKKRKNNLAQFSFPTIDFFWIILFTAFSFSFCQRTDLENASDLYSREFTETQILNCMLKGPFCSQHRNFLRVFLQPYPYIQNWFQLCGTDCLLWESSRLKGDYILQHRNFLRVFLQPYPYIQNWFQLCGTDCLLWESSRLKGDYILQHRNFLRVFLQPYPYIQNWFQLCGTDCLLWESSRLKGDYIFREKSKKMSVKF